MEGCLGRTGLDGTLFVNNLFEKSLVERLAGTGSCSVSSAIGSAASHVWRDGSVRLRPTERPVIPAQGAAGERSSAAFLFVRKSIGGNYGRVTGHYI